MVPKELILERDDTTSISVLSTACLTSRGRSRGLELAPLKVIMERSGEGSSHGETEAAALTEWQHASGDEFGIGMDHVERLSFRLHFFKSPLAASFEECAIDPIQNLLEALPVDLRRFLLYRSKPIGEWHNASSHVLAEFIIHKTK